MNKVYSLVCGLILMLVVSSCNTPEKLLCHTWKPTFVDFDEAKLSYDINQKNEIVAQLKDTMRMTFNKDHTYMLQLPDRVEKGVWRFSVTGDTLFTNYEHGGAITKINSLTKEFINAESLDNSGMEMKFILEPVDVKKKK